MSTTPDPRSAERDESGTDTSEPGDEQAAGVEIGKSSGEGSTFEPEEDPEGHG